MVDEDADWKAWSKGLVANVPEIIAGVLLVVISVVVFLEVIYRYIIQAPLPWTQEVAIFAFVWYCLLCAAVGVKYRLHFALEFLVSRLPKQLQRAIRVLVVLSTSGVLVVLVWAGMAIVVLNSGQRSPILDMPMSIPYLSVPVSATLMLLYLWRDLVRE